MSPANRYEQQFLDALKGIFVGAKVEGESGYINLMRIKSRYFSEGVFPCLMKDIDAACKPFEESFREEMFDKLYDFFKRYFSESGSIYFRHTPLHNNVYEKVYTEDRDVVLFWKTHMLYYVKTDRLFNSMDVEVDGTLFYFDVSELTHKRANEKRELVYAYKGYREGKVILSVAYSEKGRKTRSEDILRALKEKGIRLDEETLERACRVFEKQSEVDYFINKNARAFLREQFDLWLYQYVFSEESHFNERRLAQLQAIKGIAYKIIDFIAQFEDELVRVWNKPKFVLNSHYIITLDKITDPQLFQSILAHPGMEAQVQEWRDLGMIPEDFEIASLAEKNLLGEPAHGKYQYLPLDTRYFKDLELEILALFDDLDAAIDGWLIHSENYQALNTLSPKYREQVQAIYIDPPYNTGSDEFIYTDRFQHASWLSMIVNRLQAAKDWMSQEEGSIFISVDDNELAELRKVADTIFFQENFVATIIWQKVFAPKNTAKYFSVDHDYLLVYAKDKSKWSPYLLPRSAEANARYSNPDNDSRGDWASSDLTARNYYSLGTYEVTSPGGKRFRPAIGTYWRVSKENFERLNSEGRIWWGADGNNMPRLKRYLSEVKSGIVPQTLWKYEDVGNTQEAKKELLTRVSFERNEDVLNTVKPTRLLQKILEISTSPFTPGIVLDFFAGGGSTAHAVINQNRIDGGTRKYILVEMGEHFTSIILPRIKKVIFSDRWKDTKAQDGKGISHFAKYYDLEQYEEALRRARYNDGDLFSAADPYTGYVFLRDLKMLDAVSLDKGANKVKVHLEKLYEGIDLAETLSCVTGKWIKRITADTVEFQDGTSASLTDPDWTLIKPLIWW